MENGQIKFIMFQNLIIYLLYLKELYLKANKFIISTLQKFIHKLWVQKMFSRFIKISKIQMITLFI